MELNVSREARKAKGFAKKKAFSLKGDAHAFKILSDSLYSNKIRAIIRELSTNAADSHVDAGTEDKRFDVYLPTSGSPEFVIRDYGIGLSQEDVENVYTTYFESTKNTSNDYNGCLGLGSKSPFSYTDSFELISYHNGKKMIFLAQLDQQGTPEIHFLKSFDTDEPNGVKITIPVANSYSFPNWQKEAKWLYHFFDPSGPMPEVHNAEWTTDQIISGELVDQEVSTQGDGWILYESSHHVYNSFLLLPGDSYALMANVAYPINVDHYTGKYKDLLRENRLLLKFETGELEFQPSREQLSYTPEVVKAIEKKLEKVQEEIKDRVESEFAQCDNLFEALKKYCDTFNWGSPPRLIDNIKFDIEFEGVNLWEQLNIITKASKITAEKYEIEFNYNSGRIQKSELHPLYNVSRPYGGKGNNLLWANSEFNRSKKLVKFLPLVLLDVERRRYDRQIRQYLKEVASTLDQKKYDGVILMAIKGWPSSGAAEVAEAADLLGLPDTHYEFASDRIAHIKRPKKKKKGKTSTTRSTGGYILSTQSKNSGASMKDCWTKNADLDLSTIDGYYVEFSGFRYNLIDKTVTGREFTHPTVLGMLVHALKQYEILEDSDKIYGIRRKDLSKAKKNSKLRPLDSKISEIFGKLEDVEFIDKTTWNSDYYKIKNLSHKVKAFPSPFASFYTWESYLSSLKFLARRLDPESTFLKEFTNLEKLSNAEIKIQSINLKNTNKIHPNVIELLERLFETKTNKFKKEMKKKVGDIVKEHEAQKNIHFRSLEVAWKKFITKYELFEPSFVANIYWSTLHSSVLSGMANYIYSQEK